MRQTNLMSFGNGAKFSDLDNAYLIDKHRHAQFLEGHRHLAFRVDAVHLKNRFR